MSSTAPFRAIFEGLTSPSLHKHSVKTNYTSIKDTHQILTENVASVESALSRVQNGYIGIIVLSG